MRPEPTAVCLLVAKYDQTSDIGGCGMFMLALPKQMIEVVTRCRPGRHIPGGFDYLPYVCVQIAAVHIGWPCQSSV